MRTERLQRIQGQETRTESMTHQPEEHNARRDLIMVHARRYTDEELHATSRAAEIANDVEQETRRRQFNKRVKELFDKDLLKREYIKEVVCNGDARQLEAYEQRVTLYKSLTKFKRVFSKNPEVNAIPMEHGYIIAKIIEAYSDIFGNSNRPIRVLYPAAGGDTANLLAYVNQLKRRNIEFIFVDPCISSSGTPKSRIIPRYRLNEHFSVENHGKKFDAYLESDPAPIDIFLYDTWAITGTAMNGLGGTGYLSFQGINDTEKLTKLFQTNSVIIGNDVHYNNTEVFGIPKPVRELLNTGFEKMEGCAHPSVSIRQEHPEAAEQKLKAA